MYIYIYTSLSLYIYIYIHLSLCIYIYIYIHTYTYFPRVVAQEAGRFGRPGGLRPVHQLRVFLLRVLGSNFPGDSLYSYMDMIVPPLRITSLLESNPLKPELIVGGLGVAQTAAAR